MPTKAPATVRGRYMCRGSVTRVVDGLPGWRRAARYDDARMAEQEGQASTIGFAEMGRGAAPLRGLTPEPRREDVRPRVKHLAHADEGARDGPRPLQLLVRDVAPCGGVAGLRASAPDALGRTSETEGGTG